MIGFILRRFVLMFFTLVVMSMLSFAVIQLPPGDLITKYIQDLETGDGSFGLSAGGAWAGGTEATIAQAEYLRAYYGMDQPYYIRYLKLFIRLAIILRAKSRAPKEPALVFLV